MRSTRSVPVLFGLLAATSSATAQTTECVNLRPDGLALHAAAATTCSMSADGNVVAFATASTVLVPGAPSHGLIYVRDRTTNALSIASVDSAGTAASAEAIDGWISADGRHVAFTSAASNLVANDVNGVRDAFVHDRQTGATTLVSVDSAGAPLALASTATSISADGRHVAIETAAAIDPSDTNGRIDVYVRDVVNGTIVRASVGSSGAQSTGDCTAGSLSANGNRISFIGTADDLWVGDTNAFADVFVRDLAAGTTELASRSTSGVLGNAPVSTQSISGDGNVVAFATSATNLDPNVTLVGAGRHVHARDLAAGSTAMLDVNASGLSGNGTHLNHAPRLSHDGRHVVFATSSTNLVPGDLNNTGDVYAADRVAGTIARASLGACGQQGVLDVSDGARSPWVSDDGLRVAFTSAAENMVAGDSSGSERFDVFVRDATKPPIGALVCAGADSAPCPCGGPAWTSRGCSNANEAGGLFASGEARVSADTLRLGAFEISTPFSGTCIFFQGTSTVAGGAGTAFGDGVRCVGGTQIRLKVKRPDSNEGAYYPALNDVPISVAGSVPSAGGTRYYQLWYSEPGSFCTSATFNFTNAVSVVWHP